MAKKYYAVRKGKITGVYGTWAECKANVDGFSGAEYKSFTTLKEAQSFVGNGVKEFNPLEKFDVDTIIAYVDGSYNVATKEFSYGMVILHNGAELCFWEKVNQPELSDMRNVAGEIKGAEAAMRYAVKNNCKKLVIYHDYEGIAKWCLGAWQAKKDGTKAYKAYFESIKDKIEIEFVKVKAHANIKYNEMADELAKKALAVI